MQRSYSHLRWMSRKMRGGEWEIWGALAKQKEQQDQHGMKQEEEFVDLQEGLDLREAVDRLERIGGIHVQVPVASYAILLRRCGEDHALAEGRRLHAHIAKSGRVGDTYLGNLLVQMYGRCGSLIDARAAFEEIKEPNQHSWNLIIAAYSTKSSSGTQAIFDRCRNPTAIAWNTLIAAYAQCGQIAEAKQVFDRQQRAEHTAANVVSWNTLLAAYSQWTMVEEAQQVFGLMPQHNVLSWNVLLKLQQNPDLALDCFDSMPQRDAVSWIEVMKAAVRCGEVQVCRFLFDLMPQWSGAAWVLMIQAYGCCRTSEGGGLSAARNLFEDMPGKDLVCWNAIISACAHNGEIATAKAYLDAMPCTDIVSWNALLVAAANEEDRLWKVFEQMPGRDATSWNTIMMVIPAAVFDRMPQHEVITWNTKLSSQMQAGLVEQAMQLFRSMPARNFLSWNICFEGLLQTGMLSDAEELLAEKIPSCDCVQWTRLMWAHAAAGLLDQARRIFDKMHKPDTVSWNALMQAYLDNNKRGSSTLNNVKECFDRMLRRNVVSWSALMMGYIQEAHHASAAKLVFDKMPARDIVSCNAMVGLLADKGCVAEAKSLVESMRYRSHISWQHVIEGYVRKGCNKEAVELYRVMDLEGWWCSSSALLVLRACSQSLAMAQGRLVASRLLQLQIELEQRENIGQAVIEMYAKCGDVEQARQVFESMVQLKVISVASWNSMIAAYALNGDSNRAVEMFMLMVLEGLAPNTTTFVTLLSACSHSGMLCRLADYFCSILKQEYDSANEDDKNEVLSREHYVCLIDALGRAGLVEEAQELMQQIDDHGGHEDQKQNRNNKNLKRNNKIAWSSLLGACNAHGDGVRGAAAAERVIQLDPNSAVPYVVLSNMHRVNSKEGF